MTPPRPAPAEAAARPRHLALSVEQRALVRELLERHVPGVEVRAFGSRVHGPVKPASDLDLLVLSPEPVEPRRWALLADDLAESDLPFRVDLVDARTASPAFVARVLGDSVVIQPGASASAP